MAFPSPANDYVESRLNIESLCGFSANSSVIETDNGFAIIEVGRRSKQGDTLLITFAGRSQFAKLYGSALITEEGESIEGEALDEAHIHGVLTYSILRAFDDDDAV